MLSCLISPHVLKYLRSFWLRKSGIWGSFRSLFICMVSCWGEDFEVWSAYGVSWLIGDVCVGQEVGNTVHYVRAWKLWDLLYFPLNLLVVGSSKAFQIALVLVVEHNKDESDVDIWLSLCLFWCIWEMWGVQQQRFQDEGVSTSLIMFIVEFMQCIFILGYTI